VTSFSLVYICLHFGETYCLQLQSKWLF